MTKTFTNDDLVRFLYDEVNEDERLEIKKSLCADMELRASLEKMKEALKLIESFSMKPSIDVVSRILYASKNLSVNS